MFNSSDRDEYLDRCVESLNAMLLHIDFKIVSDNNFVYTDEDEEEGYYGNMILTLIGFDGTELEKEINDIKDIKSLNNFIVDFIAESNWHIMRGLDRLREINGTKENSVNLIEETDTWFGTENRKLFGIYTSEIQALLAMMIDYREIFVGSSGNYKTVSSEMELNSNCYGICISEYTLNEKA